MSNPPNESRNIELSIERLRGAKYQFLSEKYGVSVPRAYGIYIETMTRHGLLPIVDRDATIHQLVKILAKERHNA